MSMLSCATIESRFTVGWSVKKPEPSIPSSSPTCQAKMTERFGFTGAVANRSAISSTAMLPEPSSSAPL